MGFCFSSPDKKKLLKESGELVSANARVLSVCKELAEGELRDKTEKIYDHVRYMIPTASVGATQADKKIGSLAGDLKIELSRGRSRSLVRAEEIVKDIERAITERNSYTS